MWQYRLYTHICNQISIIKSTQVCQKWMQFHMYESQTTRKSILLSQWTWCKKKTKNKKSKSWRTTIFMGTHPYFQIPNTSIFPEYFLSEKRILSTQKTSSYHLPLCPWIDCILTLQLKLLPKYAFFWQSSISVDPASVHEAVMLILHVKRCLSKVVNARVKQQLEQEQRPLKTKKTKQKDELHRPNRMGFLKMPGSFDPSWAVCVHHLAFNSCIL